MVREIENVITNI